jgi:hypothetical protein
MLFERPALDVLTPVIVNQGISKRAVEPGNCRFPLEVRFVLNSFCEGRLQQLLSRGTGADPPVQEGEKSSVVLQ